ncbi:MAG: hypothetical protein GWN61_06660 [candidate division Zixibacteria bacterium]|nr:hypothetical protein [candidate division Zixibacteria bacterium]NIV05864.1 hypothetical protein [candidate division Zixibacteria bacterium]
MKRWDFHSAFDSAEDLFVDIGNKCYDFWGRVIETARLAEANDFLVISGWESTAIENHSGLLDNLRQFKGIPELLKKRLAPFRPVIKAHSLVLSKNDSLVCDLFLLNETGKSLGKEMQFSITDPEGKITELGRYQIPDFEADRFVYPITNDVSTKALSEPGKYRLRLSLVDNPNYFSEEQILVIDPIGEGQLPQKVGVLCDNKDFLAAVNSLPGLDAEMYQSEQEYDVAIVSDRLMYGWRSEVESTREIQGTEDDVLYHTESWGWKKNLEYTFYDLPPGKARVTLKFAEITLSKPGARIFDVAINGQTVLKDFDIYATAGGPNIAVDTAFTVDAPEGMVQITIPRRTVNYGKFSAIKVEAGDTTIAINCGAKQPYRDKNGLVWEVYRGRVYLNDELIERAKNGMNLLILPQGEDATLEYVNRFSKAGAFQSAGHVGKTRASWMGSWYFVREHPVFEGLPVDQALKSYYQVPVSSADGVLIEEGEGIEVFAGYGRDHDRNIGAASFTAPLGQGKILFHTFPGLISGMTGEQTGMHPVIAKRLMANSLRYLR